MAEIGAGSVAALAEIAKMGSSLSLKELAEVAQVAQSAGGTLVGFEPDGTDRCGNGRVVIRWPPKGDEWRHLFDTLVSRRIKFEVLINGIPVPDQIAVRFARTGGF